MVIRNALNILEELSAIETKITLIEKNLAQLNPQIELEEILKQIFKDSPHTRKQS